MITQRLASPSSYAASVVGLAFSGSPKYEEVYLHAYRDGWEAEINLARFLWRYCHVRPHSSLGGRTPHDVYTEIEPCSSRPGLTMSGAGTVQ